MRSSLLASLILISCARTLQSSKTSRINEQKFRKVGILSPDLLLHTDSVTITFDIERFINNLETDLINRKILPSDSIATSTLIKNLKTGIELGDTIMCNKYNDNYYTWNNFIIKELKEKRINIYLNKIKQIELLSKPTNIACQKGIGYYVKKNILFLYEITQSCPF